MYCKCSYRNSVIKKQTWAAQRTEKRVNAGFVNGETAVEILQPQTSGLDYYFITAYYLEKRFGGPNMIKQKYKNRIPEVL